MELVKEQKEHRQGRLTLKRLQKLVDSTVDFR
jgi:hypothetical protein